MPWAGKSGLAKAAALFATLLIISFGLCGVNALVSTLVSDSVTTFLAVAGSVGIAVSLTGLGITALVGFGGMILDALARGKRDE